MADTPPSSRYSLGHHFLHLYSYVFLIHTIAVISASSGAIDRHAGQENLQRSVDEYPGYYHNYTVDQHSRIFDHYMTMQSLDIHNDDTLTGDASGARDSNQNVKMISLNLHGTISDPRFAAVWVHQDGNSTDVRHQPYDNLVNTKDWIQDSLKYHTVITLISAIGDTTEEGSRWSVVMEERETRGIAHKPGCWYFRLNMTTGNASDENSFEYYNQIAHENRQILTAFTSYGSGDDLLIAASWLPNEQNAFKRWHAHSRSNPGPFQAVTYSESSLPDFRPYQFSISDDQQYTAAFGEAFGAWTSIYDVTEEEYLTKVDVNHVQGGRFPVHISAGGEGSNVRYAAIFADNIGNISKASLEDGKYAKPNNSRDPFDLISDQLRIFLQNNSIDAGQIAAYRNGTLRMAHTADWQPINGSRLTDNTTLFPLAGLSEIFLSAAIANLYASNQISPTAKAYTFFPNLTRPLDPRSDSITVEQLLNHRSGYAPSLSSASFDPLFSMREIALNLSLPNPIQKFDIVRYVYAIRPLEIAPGTASHHASYNYLLLSAIIEVITEQDYLTWLTENIIRPANISIEGWPTLIDFSSPVPNNYVHPKDQALGPSAVYPHQEPRNPMPHVYSGDGLVKEVAVGCLGLAGTANSLASFIARNAVRGFGGRVGGKSKVGSIAGGFAYAESRDDGWDWAFVLNSRDWNGWEGEEPWRGLVGRVNKILDGVGSD